MYRKAVSDQMGLQGMQRLTNSSASDNGKCQDFHLLINSCSSC